MKTNQFSAFARKQPIALGCAVVCLVVAGWIYFRLDALSLAQSELADKSAEGSRIAANITNAAQLNEQSAAMIRAVQQIESRLVHSGDLATNLQYFYKIESDTQVKLNELRQIGQTGGRGAGPTYAAIDYGLSAKGTYPQIIDFVRRVENGPHYARITDITLSRMGDASGVDPSSVFLSLDLSLDLLGWP
jgi:Tfp pilus assembly protein PilO